MPLYVISRIYQSKADLLTKGVATIETAFGLAGIAEPGGRFRDGMRSTVRHVEGDELADVGLDGLRVESVRAEVDGLSGDEERRHAEDDGNQRQLHYQTRKEVRENMFGEAEVCGEIPYKNRMRETRLVKLAYKEAVPG